MLVMNSKAWANHLKVDIEFRDLHNRQLDGSQNHTLWFRFIALQNVSSSRSSRSSVHSNVEETLSSFTPRSESSEEYLNEHYEKLEANGQLHSRAFANSEVLDFIRQIREESIEADFVHYFEDSLIESSSTGLDVSPSSAASLVEEKKAFVKCF